MKISKLVLCMLTLIIFSIGATSIKTYAAETVAAKDDLKAAKKVKTQVKKEKKYTDSELRLLSCLIYSEAGYQSYKGKLAVANVVLNRVKSDIFSHANTVKEVIYDSKWGVQFSVIIKDDKGTSPLGKALDLYDSKKYQNESEKNNMEESIKAAKAALEGENNIGDYLYFSGDSSRLEEKYPDHIILGEHIFYNN
ncbi:hypothetical protein Ana3638_01850 [Anaerocolumna sedimenticola]|uniref:Cell wall hydrolase SleB domain-containing protein n=1 Tax=Anaerocolumna sedimenticola TaxID=2696063 RepID=A0A6P1THX5_9FIRM|nr:cell wall hydrolase [Anaerocolumna sedimenticola]QHQ59692.1 hypothetical protein Ana3638_01850 [Anaerocolumna sedimenticola]